MNFWLSVIRPCLFALDPEWAHEVTLLALQTGLYPRPRLSPSPLLAQSIWGLNFANPLGMAAGYDKDARVPGALLKLGFAFTEIGTITPLPQPGNPKPRLFRLTKDHAVINRLGFNSGGHDAAFNRLNLARPNGIVGINVGANKESADRTEDYVKGLEKFYPLASYFMANISSPNTPGLRDLQAPAALDDLLERMLRARDRLIEAGAPRKPIIVKIAPDIADEDLPAIVDRLVAHNVDGIAVSNTTLSRDGILDRKTGKQAGGLSGRPLFHRATVLLARVYRLTSGRIPIVGIGGIDSGATALAKIKAGASLVQIYSGLVYEGPGLVSDITSHLAHAVEAEGVASISNLVGRDADTWADKNPEG
jgi:dihydroorotate dehydrogenase